MKKTLTVYGMLFLFAFTFGLSFTLASKAQAAPGVFCCVIEWCPDPRFPGIIGTDNGMGGGCTYTGTGVCDQINQCDW